MKADFIPRKHFTSLLIILCAKTQRGNNHLGNLPNSAVTRRTCNLGDAKLGRQSVGITTVLNNSKDCALPRLFGGLHKPKSTWSC